MYIYIYTNLPVNGIVRSDYPLSPSENSRARKRFLIIQHSSMEQRAQNTILLYQH